jgi:hypothetical protein
MENLKLSNWIKKFKVKRISVSNDLNSKKSIFYLPEDFICYVDDEYGAVSFQKFEAVFSEMDSQILFYVVIDDFLYIDMNYKLTDDDTKKAFFGQVAKGKKAPIKYSSIHERVAAVYTALCQGKLRIGDVNKVED